MRRRGIAWACAALFAVIQPAAASEMFEGSLDCVKPRLDLLRGLCADPELLALAREVEGLFKTTQARLKSDPALLADAEAINSAFVSSLMSFFDQERMHPLNALKRHKALLVSIEAHPGKGIAGAWTNNWIDLNVTGSGRLSATMRSQGFGQNPYDCRWQTRVLPTRGGWQTDTGPKDADDRPFHVTLKRQKASVIVEKPEQEERVPDDCPPWANMTGLFIPVSAKARLDQMPSVIIPPRERTTDKKQTIEDVLRLLPGPAFPEHAPGLTRDILNALIDDKTVEGWSLVRQRPDTIDIARSDRKDRIVFQFATPDRTEVEMITFHDGTYHLAEWRLRADGRTVYFAVPSLIDSVLRLFPTTRGGFRDGLPRAGLTYTDLTPDISAHIFRLAACRYFGDLRKAGPSLRQSEIDQSRTNNRCGERDKLEQEIRDRRGQFPDALRILDLANRLVQE